MSISRGSLQERLRAGIDAAKQGDKPTARKLLQQVLSVDQNNEVAWMWMASVVETLAERRVCLEKALAINPNNTQAQEALRRLNADKASDEKAAAPRIPMKAAPGRTRQRRGFLNTYTALALVILVFVIILVLYQLVISQVSPVETPIPTQIAGLGGAQQGVQPVHPPSGPPTLTPTVFGVIVTHEPNAANLPPTFTPTTTDTPSPTPTPTATPFPLALFKLVYTSTDAGAAQPGLFTMSADGTGIQPLGSGADGFRDVAFSPDGRRIAFVRDLQTAPQFPPPTPTQEPTLNLTPLFGNETATPTLEPTNPPAGVTPEIFVAPIDNIGAAVQITQMNSHHTGQPSWSPDGSQIAFYSDRDGDDEIWVIGSDGANLTQVTMNNSVDKDPAWSPDGRTIVFTSDLNSPGFHGAPGLTEIYSMTAQGANITQLSDQGGNSYSPAWSPDGAKIVYVGDANGDPDIFMMDADGERPNLITVDDGGARDSAPVFTPDGTWIGFVSNRGGVYYNLFLINMPGPSQQVIPLTNDNRDAQSLSFVPGMPQ